MAALLSTIASAGLIGLVSTYWSRFSWLPLSKVPGPFRMWLLRGVGVPLFVVFVHCSGLAPTLYSDCWQAGCRCRRLDRILHWGVCRYHLVDRHQPCLYALH